MVTKNRVHLARRALECFSRQSWENKELVIIDDGEEDYSPLVNEFTSRHTIRYLKVKNDGALRLGGLRNISLDQARGDFCIQWDDDEWYDDTRIAAQMVSMQRQNLEGIVLFSTLMHLDTPDFVEHPYRSNLRRGIPGTILHRKTDVRYPNDSKGEDTRFLADLRREMRIGIMDIPHSHLFIRCFHGANTWDEKHFLERLHFSFRDKLSCLYARYCRRDIRTHRRFRLTDEERRVFGDCLRFSREHGLFRN